MGKEIENETVKEEKDEQKKDKKWLLFLLIGLIIAGVVAGTLLFLNRKLTVTFDTDGGTEVAAVQVKKGETVSQPVDPTKEGYDFTGWYFGEQAYDFAQPVTSSITIKAHWDVSKYVTFLVDGKEYAKVHIVNKRIVFPESPTMDGFAFIEWQKDDGTAISEADEFDQDLTVSAAFRVFIPVTSIKFEKPKYTAYVDAYSSIETKLVISPDNWAENIKYESSNPDVAKVAQDGKVTGLKAGTVTITATTETGKTATCEVEVLQQVHNIEFDVSNKDTMIVGETQVLKFTLLPAEATEKLKIYSTDEKILKIDSNMKVTAVGAGKARIDFDGKYMQATFIITVYDLSVPETLTLDMGETKNIGAKILPDNKTTGIKYQSDDEMVAKVDANGNVYGVEGGKCKIKVYTDSGMSKTVTVYVNEYTLLVDLKGTGTAANLPTGTYILYYSNDRPLLKVSEATLRVTEKGVDKFVKVDINKLDLITGTDNIAWWASHNEVYATNFSDVIENFYRVTDYTVHWEYPYNGKTVKSMDFEITVEPPLSVSVGYLNSTANGLTWNINKGEGQINLPSTAGTHEFRIVLNQKVEYTKSSNLNVSMTVPAATSGKPEYRNYDCKYSKTTSSSPAWIKFVTPGGQVIYFKAIR